MRGGEGSGIEEHRQDEGGGGRTDGDEDDEPLLTKEDLDYIVNSVQVGHPSLFTSAVVGFFFFFCPFIRIEL